MQLKVELRGNFEAYVFQKNKRHSGISCLAKYIINYLALFYGYFDNYKEWAFRNNRKEQKSNRSLQVVQRFYF